MPVEPAKLASIVKQISKEIKAEDLEDEIEFLLIVSSGPHLALQRFCHPDRLLTYGDAVFKQRHGTPPEPVALKEVPN